MGENQFKKDQNSAYARGHKCEKQKKMCRGAGSSRAGPDSFICKKKKEKKSEYANYDNNRNKVSSDIQLLVIRVCSNIIITEILSRAQVTGAQFF